MIAEQQTGAVRVHNDRLIVGGNIILSDEEKFQTASAPREDILQNMFAEKQYNQSSQIRLKCNLPNESYSSQGTAVYRCILSTETELKEERKFQITEVNPVVIHTPVVCIPKLYAIIKICAAFIA